jgi:hypothetical protein
MEKEEKRYKLKGFEEKTWDYLCRKLNFLNDNNKIAKDIYKYIDRMTRQKIGIDRIVIVNENKKSSN